jgi:hypothetical protein
MTKESVLHKDALGRILKIGDCVAYPLHNSLGIGTVKKLNPKMVGVAKVDSKYRSTSNKYPNDLVLLDGPEVTMYLIKNSSPA